MKRTTLALLAKILPSVGLGLLLSMAVPACAQVTFSAPVSYTVGTNPKTIITADFNGDGIPDLAVANRGDSAVNDLGSVSLLLGKGDGTFEAARDALAGPFPSFIISGDFNGDRKLDLLVIGEASSTTGLAPWNILLGQGDGSFGAPLQVELTNFNPSLVVGDFNNDKKMDLVFIDPTSNSLQEAAGNGDGSFQTPVTLETASGSRLVSGDFDGDGNLDLAIENSSGGEVLMGKGDGTFRQPLLGGMSLSANFVAVDMNGDGRTDIFAGTVQTSLRPCGLFGRAPVDDYFLEPLLSNGDGTFLPEPNVATSSFNICHRTGNAISYASVGDFDGDGKLDVAVNGAAIFGGRGNGIFPTNLGTLTFSGSPIAVDLNGDRLADPGAEPLTSNTIGVVLNTTQGFWLGAPSLLGPLRAGGSATATISVNPQSGFTNSVSLACSTPQMVGIQCSLSPSSVTPGASSALTITTTGATAGAHAPANHSHPEWLYALGLPFVATVFGGLGLGSKPHSKKKLAAMAIGCLMVAILFQAACGGESKTGSGGTPSGNYTVTITGTSGTTTRFTNITLKVQ